MMNKKINLFLCSAACIMALSACSSAKEQLGLTRQSPDEFAVVKRAPLAMPPEYTLRPPTPGAPRPQEAAMDQQAREAVFGNEKQEKTAPTSAEDALLQQAGGDEAMPGIREIVNKETAALEPKSKPVAEKLLGWGKKGEPPASVVDAAAEAERLQTNAEDGKPVTDGETPAIEE